MTAFGAATSHVNVTAFLILSWLNHAQVCGIAVGAPGILEDAALLSG